jgi:lactoylglutathione lyase
MWYTFGVQREGWNMPRKHPQAKSSIPGLSVVERVILYVRDTERSARWYAQVLGLPLRGKEPGWVEFETKGVALCLHGGRQGGRRPELNAVSFKVDDFDAAYRALQIQEVEDLTEPFSPAPGYRCASFLDPDGNVIGIEGR